MAEEETTGTPLPGTQENNWEDDTRIVEGKLFSEAGENLREEEPKEEEKEEVVEEKEEEDDQFETVQPPAQLQDPGEFEPNDYSFEVVTYDSEGNNAKNITINSIEQFEELLDKDANFGSPANLLKAQRKATKMETQLEADKREHQKKVDEFTSKKEQQEARNRATNNMVSEINYLIENGDLPAVAKEYQSADWGDEEVAKQPGVKEQIDLLNFMRRENNKRMKHNLEPMKSVIDAFNAYQLDKARKGAVERKASAGQARKTAGAKVAGSSPSPVSVAPKGVSVGRGGSLRDIGNSNWDNS